MGNDWPIRGLADFTALPISPFSNPRCFTVIPLSLRAPTGLDILLQFSHFSAPADSPILPYVPDLPFCHFPILGPYRFFRLIPIGTMFIRRFGQFYRFTNFAFYRPCRFYRFTIFRFAPLQIWTCFYNFAILAHLPILPFYRFIGFTVLPFPI